MHVIIYAGTSGCRVIVLFHKLGMITAAAPTFPHLRPSVASATLPSATQTVTCIYSAKVTIYHCRISGYSDAPRTAYARRYGGPAELSEPFRTG